MVQLPNEDLEPIVARLRRVHGQLGGILRMIEERRDCEAIVTQVAAASKALDRAGYALIATGLKECLLHPDGSLTNQQMERLFLSLA
jgi:DNA-binding FrmR family transcriptional regulator